MKKHILLEKAFRYPEPTIDLAPANCTYERKKGYWINNYSKKPMMLSDNPRGPQTKKADRETGEDLKGE